MLKEKYKSVLEMAEGLDGLSVEEDGGLLRIKGTAANAGEIRRLEDEAVKVDAAMSVREVVFEIENAGGESYTTYTVRPGDTLSAIGAKYGVSWQAIFEANREILDDPDLIHSGQELVIPGV